MNLSIMVTTFAVIFPAELPDKTMVAALVLGSKYKAHQVFAGLAAAFALQVVIAVAAGRILTLLPHRLLEGVVGILFAIGAVLIFREHGGKAEAETQIQQVQPAASFWKVSLTAFTVVFLAEFGDLTQIATANLAAKFGHPLSVGIGSVLALWAVGAIGVWGGQNVLRVIPMKIFTLTAALLLAGLSVTCFMSAV